MVVAFKWNSEKRELRLIRNTQVINVTHRVGVLIEGIPLTWFCGNFLDFGIFHLHTKKQPGVLSVTMTKQKQILSHLYIYMKQKTPDLVGGFNPFEKY